MRNKNLITLAITDGQASNMDNAITAMETETRDFIALTTLELRRLRKLGEKSESFARQALHVVSQNPQMIPENIPVADALNDLKVLDILRPRLARLTRLVERANHTYAALGHDILTVALQAYGLLKLTGKSEGMEGLRRDLAGLFNRSKSQPKAEVPGVEGGEPKRQVG